MAGGRDPWRGADKPSQLQSYGDLPPRRAVGQPPQRHEPQQAAGPSASFDSRSIFIGPADQDPRPAREPRDRPHRSPYGADGFGSAPAEPHSSVFADPYAPPGPPAPPDDPDYDDWDRPSHAAGSGRTARSWRQRVILGVGVFLVVMCLAGATVAFWVVRTYNSIDRVDGLELNAVAAGEPQNYLVVGSDFREGEVSDKRSDSIMVLRIDPKSEQAYALSFPRDLRVQIAGSTGSPQKINSAYNGDAGIQRLIDTLQQNFAIPIHHYVEIDFNGFKGLIDHIGGVPLYFDQAVRNPPGEHDVGLHITELGCVTVGSEQALALARSRELEYRAPDGWVNDLLGDYGRMTRQQIVIKQALKKAAQQAQSNPLQLRGMAELAAETVTLDASLTISDLLDLANQFQDFDPNNLLTFSLPTRTTDAEGKSDPYPDEALAEPVLNAFRGLPIDEIGPSLIDLTVVNGSGQEGQAANVAGAFQKIGFDVTVAPGAAPEPVARTTVFHAPGGEAYGRRVARHLESGADVQPRDDLAPGEVELVTGADFTNVFEEPAPIGATTTTAAPPPASGDSGGSADTTASTAAPPASTATTAPPAPPPSTPQVGYPAGQPPPGKTCG